MSRHGADYRVTASRIRVTILLCLIAAGSIAWMASRTVRSNQPAERVAAVVSPPRRVDYRPRIAMDASGFGLINDLIVPWKADATLSEIRDAWDGVGQRAREKLDRDVIENEKSSLDEKLTSLCKKAQILNYEGDPKNALVALDRAMSLIGKNERPDQDLRYSIVYLQGVTGLRRGENENCIMCRGESSCILPISHAAVHTVPDGSRLAIQFFTEYLNQFPEDLAVRWLLNIAHMTLGEYPDNVDPRFKLSLDQYMTTDFDIGKFRDIGHAIGVNRFNQSGGAIMDDFDNDGLLDIVTTTLDPTESMNLLRNTGSGTFEDLTDQAGLKGQLGGLNCMQTDYNNDGWMDIFIVRGAWLSHPMRPTLLRNNRNGTFLDVTEEAGLLEPVNSIAASWADYDNDGWLDLFVCCEKQRSRLYHNLRNGAFEEVALKAGVTAVGTMGCKGAAWIDYDNDGFPDLFQNYYLPNHKAQLFHNNRDGTFHDVSRTQDIDGPVSGFSCWAWDYDNDGWLDIFATCYERSVDDIVKGLMGQPHVRNSNRLYRNMHGRGFKDVTKDAGLDLVFSTMGSNFGDFDNDGFLDMYLGTGDPDLATLIPNRMFKSVAGKRFAEITASSGTGSLQKGHGVACGDWDRDGNNDIFIEMGGAVNGDKYHNILFQNPGHKNSWLTVKLKGEKTNKPAIGARIKVITAGEAPQTIHRHISSGSSFGANPLQQTIGLAQAERVTQLEIYWPTSGTTQVFRDLAVNQAIEITEFAADFKKLDWSPVPIPEIKVTKPMRVVENSVNSKSVASEKRGK